jgi:hypothetical protein
MKKILSNPGFEFIFAFSLIIILGVPPVLMAQAKKDLEIKIVNGDTTINGKNMKDLSPKERKEALSDIKHLNGGMMTAKGSGTFVFKGADSAGMKGYHTFTFKQNDDKGLYMTEDDSDKGLKHITMRGRRGNFPPMKTENITIIRTDSAGSMTETVRGGGGRNMNSRMSGPVDVMNRRTDGPMMGMGDRKNTQNFNYVNTDKDGISTHVSFHVSEASNDDLKRMPHVEGGKFEIEDLNIVPEFTSGKTLLMFSLPSKAIAEVKLHDSEGRLLWSEKTVNGNFSKTFAMGLNGIYYLQIKQGNNISVKKIRKEG